MKEGGCKQKRTAVHLLKYQIMNERAELMVNSFKTINNSGHLSEKFMGHHLLSVYPCQPFNVSAFFRQLLVLFFEGRNTSEQLIYPSI